MAIAQDLRATGERLIQQAQEQERASGAGGAGGFVGGGGRWGPGAGGSFADGVRSANDLLAWPGRVVAVADRLGHVPGAGAVGHVVDGFDYFTDGVTIGDDLANGRYVDAGLHGVLTGGDLTADALKMSKTPQGYLGGVAVQAWTQAGRAAMDVDWSAQGMQQIADASLDDWGAAFGDAAKQMPGQLVDIFF
jgi:hypothetical protein